MHACQKIVQQKRIFSQPWMELFSLYVRSRAQGNSSSSETRIPYNLAYYLSAELCRPWESASDVLAGTRLDLTSAIGGSCEWSAPKSKFSLRISDENSTKRIIVLISHGTPHDMDEFFKRRSSHNDSKTGTIKSSKEKNSYYGLLWH